VAPPSTSIPFQPTNVNTLNQQITVGDIGVLGQGIQNIPDMNSGVSTINDDDSDIEMDISEFLQFPPPLSDRILKLAVSIQLADLSWQMKRQ
jgi:hypothetical protein